MSDSYLAGCLYNPREYAGAEKGAPKRICGCQYKPAEVTVRISTREPYRCLGNIDCENWWTPKLLEVETVVPDPYPSRMPEGRLDYVNYSRVGVGLSGAVETAKNAIRIQVLNARNEVSMPEPEVPTVGHFDEILACNDWYPEIRRTCHLAEVTGRSHMLNYDHTAIDGVTHDVRDVFSKRVYVSSLGDYELRSLTPTLTFDWHWSTAPECWTHGVPAEVEAALLVDGEPTAFVRPGSEQGKVVRLDEQWQWYNGPTWSPFDDGHAMMQTTVGLSSEQMLFDDQYAPQCRVDASDLRLGFDVAAVRSDVRNLRILGKMLQELIARARLLHNMTLDEQTGAACLVDAVANRVLDYERAACRESCDDPSGCRCGDIAFPDLRRTEGSEECLETCYDACASNDYACQDACEPECALTDGADVIVATIDAAAAQGALPREAAVDPWQFFLDKQQSLSAQCSMVGPSISTVSESPEDYRAKFGDSFVDNAIGYSAFASDLISLSVVFGALDAALPPGEQDRPANELEAAGALIE